MEGQRDLALGFLARSPCREADVLRTAAPALPSLARGGDSSDPLCCTSGFSEDITEWRLTIKETMLCTSSRMRIASGLI